MQCPRRDCKNNAEQHPTFGVLPCRACQQRDGRIPARKFEFASIRKLHRIQAQRDKHLGDLEQPYIGNKANPDYFRQYPDQVDIYNVREELEKI